MGQVTYSCRPAGHTCCLGVTFAQSAEEVSESGDCIG
jgi:hypothetical protein